jgi:hypothetical protein
LGKITGVIDESTQSSSKSSTFVLFGPIEARDQQILLLTTTAMVKMPSMTHGSSSNKNES